MAQSDDQRKAMFAQLKQQDLKTLTIRLLDKNIDPVLRIKINQEVKTRELKEEKQVIPKFAKWGFDTTDFKKDGFQKIIKELGLFQKPQGFFTQDLDGNPQRLAWEWRTDSVSGRDITIVTVNNPVTGEHAQTIFKRPNEKDFAGAIGIEGSPAEVLKAVKLIKMNAEFIKGESPNDRDVV